ADVLPRAGLGIGDQFGVIGIFEDSSHAVLPVLRKRLLLVRFGLPLEYALQGGHERGRRGYDAGMELDRGARAGVEALEADFAVDGCIEEHEIAAIVLA